MKVVFGVINISDRASKGEYADLPGQEVKKILEESLNSKFEIKYAIVPDEQKIIENHLKTMSDEDQCAMVITTGGTGPSKRDVTPEATMAVCEKILPGFGELMRMTSLKFVPTAILSRQTAGIRNSTLIVNLPGKPTAIRQCMEVILPAVADCMDILGHTNLKWNEDCVKTYRPHTS